MVHLEDCMAALSSTWSSERSVFSMYSPSLGRVNESMNIRILRSFVESTNCSNRAEIFKDISYSARFTTTINVEGSAKIIAFASDGEISPREVRRDVKFATELNLQLTSFTILLALTSKFLTLPMITFPTVNGAGFSSYFTSIRLPPLICLINPFVNRSLARTMPIYVSPMNSITSPSLMRGELLVVLKLMLVSTLSPTTLFPWKRSLLIT